MSLVLYVLPVKFGISLFLPQMKLTFIFDMVNSNSFVKNRINKATLIVQRTFEGKYLVELCSLFCLHRVINSL
jgi:hypothetical protein